MLSTSYLPCTAILKHTVSHYLFLRPFIIFHFEYVPICRWPSSVSSRFRSRINSRTRENQAVRRKCYETRIRILQLEKPDIKSIPEFSRIVQTIFGYERLCESSIWYLQWMNTYLSGQVFHTSIEMVVCSETIPVFDTALAFMFHAYCTKLNWILGGRRNGVKCKRAL